jgi:hypothetical protein
MKMNFLKQMILIKMIGLPQTNSHENTISEGTPVDGFIFFFELILCVFYCSALSSLFLIK